MGTGHGFVVTEPQWPWRCNVVNDGDLAEFVSFTGLILLNTGGAEHYDSDRILTTPAPKLEEAEEKSSRQ